MLLTLASGQFLMTLDSSVMNVSIGRKRAFAIVRNAPQTFTAIVGIAVLAVILDFVWKRVRDTPASASHATTSS